MNVHMVIYRYRKAKPADGHVSFKFHEDGQVVFFAEHWHSERAEWEIVIDVHQNTAKPLVDYRFFLATRGDDLTGLGEYGHGFLIGTHQAKTYGSYLYETTHLSDEELALLRVERTRYHRRRPDLEERSVSERMRDALRAPEKLRSVGPPADPPELPDAPRSPERSVETA